MRPTLPIGVKKAGIEKKKTLEEQQRSVTLNEIKKINNICHVGGSCSRIIIIFNPDRPSRCFPIQHLCNVLAAVFLGPVYGVSMAFCTALIRNLLGTGSLLAFPGSMVGAFVSAMIFKYTRSKIGAYLGEVIGTGILGGMLCYPIASMMMGQKAALFTFVGPFLASTLCGTVIAAVIITALYKSKAVRLIENI